MAINECPNCGAILSDSDFLCAYCGAKNPNYNDQVQKKSANNSCSISSPANNLVSTSDYKSRFFQFNGRHKVVVFPFYLYYFGLWRLSI